MKTAYLNRNSFGTRWPVFTYCPFCAELVVYHTQEDVCYYKLTLLVKHYNKLCKDAEVK